MTDIRRTFLWFVFAVSLFLIWNAWNRHNGEPSFFEPPRPARPPAAAVPSSVGTPISSSTATPRVGDGRDAIGNATAAPVVSERSELSTDLFKATVSSDGGSLVRVELLKEVDQAEPSLLDRFEALFAGHAKQAEIAAKRNVVLLDQESGHTYVAQTGLFAESGASDLPNDLTPMTLVPGPRTLQPGQGSVQARFESPVKGGVKLVKTYTFHRGSYVIDVKDEVVNEGAAPVAPKLYLQLLRDGSAGPGGSSFYSTFTGPAVYTDATKYKKVDFKSIDKRIDEDRRLAEENKPKVTLDYETPTDNGWVAMVQHYFASVWILPPGTHRELFTGKVTRYGQSLYAVGMIVPLGSIAPGASKTLDATLFVGPQEENKLSALAPQLELVKDYGIFKILSEPLFWLLTQLHKVLGNWGWSIVGLVVLLKIAFFWLNAKAYGSMAKMKAINPRITEMRARLKDKPQQMQQEMMRIYREEKVNPLGGCLPIVVQMPFFIALYWVLLSSVEMRNAPWIGWITDLSAKDPYFILPLLMTCTSLLQTWLNPTPPDPVQAKMMWFMPLIFSVMFFVFPAGLVLYWLTNNILSIAQQYIINKRLGVIGK